MLEHCILSWGVHGAGTIKSSVLAQQLSTARIQASIAQLAKAADDKLAPLRAEIIRLKQTQQAMASTKPAAQLLKKVRPGHQEKCIVWCRRNSP